jgi:cytochrome c peroxidase
MFRNSLFILFFSTLAIISFSFRESEQGNTYQHLYHNRLQSFGQQETQLLQLIQQSDLNLTTDIERIKTHIQHTRNSLKTVDFWLRYLHPLSHKKINGPLPVEWETEVFEKFEKPYKREGAGLTLAYQYLDKPGISKNTLSDLIRQSITVMPSYLHDSITILLQSYHHFFLCNRLYLLNLATIYTTGFECPDTDNIIPELRLLLTETHTIYQTFNESFPATPLSENYLTLYTKAIRFADQQSCDYKIFDHYTFIRDYINPLFALNQQMILQYKVISSSLIDYSLNKQATSIFSKSLYNGQNPKGIFYRVTDAAVLAELSELGKQLFYDPILSGNNERSCVSCHSPTQLYTDTTYPSSLAYDRQTSLPRNTPTLVNAQFNHLLMADGQHYTLQSQTKGVVSNPAEMGGSEAEMVAKVNSCKDYVKTFGKLLVYTPQEKKLTADHIASTITFYYSKFSKFDSPFDQAMNKQIETAQNIQQGFNLFMGKAQCATCHFAPQFNGVKPPYIGSEFEVIGVPDDSAYLTLSTDRGRYEINPAEQTLFAFRTGTIRNAAHTKPYMHNGVFETLEQVIDFYDAGGGAGRGFSVPNQTLSSDSLHLSAEEKKQLIVFIHSLSETIPPEQPPATLPLSSNRNLNNRKIGGLY